MVYYLLLLTSQGEDMISNFLFTEFQKRIWYEDLAIVRVMFGTCNAVMLIVQSSKEDNKEIMHKFKTKFIPKNIPTV